MLTTWNATQRTIPARGLSDLVGAQARRTPSAPAIIGPDGVISYRGLEERANALAHRLIREGVGPERLVALLLPRGVEGIVARLAVLRAGGAFLPIDPAYPADRVAFMLADARPALVLSLTGQPPVAGRVLCLDTDVIWAGLPTDPPTAVVEPDHPAYVIYTSGSTGRPKGVVVTHRGLASFSAAEIERYDVRAGRPGPAVLLAELRRLGAGAVHVAAGGRGPGRAAGRPAARRASWPRCCGAPGHPRADPAGGARDRAADADAARPADPDRRR